MTSAADHNVLMALKMDQLYRIGRTRWTVNYAFQNVKCSLKTIFPRKKLISNSP